MKKKKNETLQKLLYGGYYSRTGTSGAIDIDSKMNKFQAHAEQMTRPVRNYIKGNDAGLTHPAVLTQQITRAPLARLYIV